jgi:DNA-binding transcriptional regulator YiaG
MGIALQERSQKSMLSSMAHASTRQKEATQLARVRDLVRSGAARSVRRAAGLSYRELARSADVAPSTVYRWEHQVQVPRGVAALRYLETLEELMSR